MNDKIQPVLPQKQKKIEVNNSITDEKFNEIIRTIYELMLEYSRIKKVFLTKDRPFQVGNVEFWFEADKQSGRTQLKFSRSVVSWDEELIQQDIQNHIHNLYYMYSPA